MIAQHSRYISLYHIPLTEQLAFGLASLLAQNKLSTIIETDLNMPGLHHFGSTTSEPVVSAIMAPRTYRHSSDRRRQQRGERSSDALPRTSPGLRRADIYHFAVDFSTTFSIFCYFFGSAFFMPWLRWGRGFRQMGMR